MRPLVSHSCLARSPLRVTCRQFVSNDRDSTYFFSFLARRGSSLALVFANREIDSSFSLTLRRRVMPMFEVSSREASDETSFGVKLCLRRTMVELMGQSGFSTAIPPYPALT